MSQHLKDEFIERIQAEKQVKQYLKTLVDPKPGKKR